MICEECKFFDYFVEEETRKESNEKLPKKKKEYKKLADKLREKDEIFYLDDPQIRNMGEEISSLEFDIYTGHCLRYPPKLLVPIECKHHNEDDMCDQGYEEWRYEWPIVLRYKWCGEFELDAK